MPSFLWVFSLCVEPPSRWLRTCLGMDDCVVALFDYACCCFCPAMLAIYNRNEELEFYPNQAKSEVSGYQKL